MLKIKQHNLFGGVDLVDTEKEETKKITIELTIEEIEVLEKLLKKIKNDTTKKR